MLAIPADMQPVAYLCLGFVEAFSSEPDLERAGWQGRMPLRSVLALDRYDADWNPEEDTR